MYNFLDHDLDRPYLGGFYHLPGYFIRPRSDLDITATDGYIGIWAFTVHRYAFLRKIPPIPIPQIQIRGL